MTAMALISIATGMFSCKDDKPEVEKVYTVTFDADGGNPVPAAQEVKAGETVTAPTTNPSKQGYVFLFWRLKGVETAYNFQTAVTGNITLQAKWEAEAKVEYWQVTWNLNGGAWPDNDNHATQVVKGGTLAEPIVPVKTGSIFKGWYKDEALTNKVTFPYDVKTVTANFMLYAKWEDIDPKVEYFGTWREVYDDGSWEQITINADMIVYHYIDGQNFTIEGLTWSEIENPSGGYISDYPVGYKVTGTMTVNNDYNNIPKENGSGNAVVGDVVHFSYYISDDKQSIMDGNWETAEQEAAYGPYYKKNDVEYWQVTWNLNGGAWPAIDNHATQVAKDSKLAAPAVPVKSGNYFGGWYKEAALTNQVLFPYDVSSITGNFTLYAKWDDSPQAAYYGTWRMVFTSGSDNNFWGQITISANKVVFLTKDGYGYTLEELNWTETNNTEGSYTVNYPAGYRVTGTMKAFNGYNVPKADGSGNCAVNNIALNSFYISADKQSIMMGNWESVAQEARYGPYKKKLDVEYWQVTWNLDGGAWPTNPNHVTQVAKDGKIAAPNDPTKTGSAFGGWFTNPALTNSVTFPYDVSSATGNIPLYAKWDAMASIRITIDSAVGFYTSITIQRWTEDGKWANVQNISTAPGTYMINNIMPGTYYRIAGEYWSCNNYTCMCIILSSNFTVPAGQTKNITIIHCSVVF